MAEDRSLKLRPFGAEIKIHAPLAGLPDAVTEWDASNTRLIARQASGADRSLMAREDTLDKIEFLGLVAGLLTTFAFLPQAVKTWRTRSAHDFSLPPFVNAGSWYRAVDDLRSDASRAIDLACKRYHNGIGRFQPEREATTGAAKFKLRHYLCSRAL